MNLKFKSVKPDPRILLLQIVCTSVLSFTFTNWIAIIVLFLLTALLTIILKNTRAGIKACAVYGIFLFLFWSLQVVSIPVVSQILPMFLLLMVRVYPVYLLCGVLVHRTPMNELLAALSHWSVPQAVLIPLVVIYRYIPTITMEIGYVNESLKMRGFHASLLSVLQHPIQSAERFLLPLLFRSEMITEELSASCLCKGLTTYRKRTCCTDVRLGWQDILYGIGIAIVMLFLLYINYSA